MCRFSRRWRHSFPSHLGSAPRKAWVVQCHTMTQRHNANRDPAIQSETCVFCDIVSGLVPASVVHEDDLAVAFMDIHPLNAGHVLVIPRAHHPRLATLPESTGAHLFTVGQRVAAAIRGSGARCEAINLFLSDGEAAGQEAPHCHLHVLPRFHGDSVTLGTSGSVGSPRPELDHLAEQIAAALGGQHGLLDRSAPR